MSVTGPGIYLATDRLVEVTATVPTDVDGTIGNCVSGVDVLFEPVRIGGLELANRIVMAPMGTGLERDGHITADSIAYYARRANSGAATITVEGCLVSEQTRGPEPKISSARYLPGLSKLAMTLRDGGAVAGVQLMQPGRQVVEGPSIAPSPIRLNSVSPVPHELSRKEIAELVADYGRAARLAAQAGFQFVEVHGAHGYLPSNFLSPSDNVRADLYGGTLNGRARFSLEVARSILDATAGELPVIWRLNGEDAVPRGMQIGEATAVAALLEAEGVAAISVSGGTWHSLHVTLAPMGLPRGALVAHAAAVKAAVRVPVMGVGRLDDPVLAAEIVAAGKIDLVCLGRGLIAEPDWSAKVRSGRLDDLRPCIACNACVDRVGRGERARCSVNSEVGRELTWDLTPAAASRSVMVIGSGPAGLEAARVAQARGHRVSLWERGARLGGKLEVAGLAPSKAEVLRFRDFQTRLVEQLGVEIHAGVEVDAELIAKLAPEVVILAVGADPTVPPIPGIGTKGVSDAIEILSGAVPLAAGEKLVIIGGSATGCETAEFAAARGAHVTILEMQRSIGRGIEPITRRLLLADLNRCGVDLRTDARVMMIEPGEVLFELGDGELRTVAWDRVALAIGWNGAGSTLASRLEDRDGPEVVVLGDATMPADFVSAINSGADAGLRL